MTHLGSIVAVAALSASTAAAQPAPPPKVERTHYPFVAMNGYQTRRDPSEPAVMRRASPVGEAADWLAQDDPVVGMVTRGEIKDSMASLILSIDAQGRATECRIARQRGDARFAEGLCDRVMPKVRMIPALTDDGERVADTYEAYVSSAVAWEKTDRLAKEQMLPPVVAAPGSQWPPTSTFTGFKIAKLDLLQRPPAASEALEKTWAGVFILPRRTPPFCRVEGSSGDAKFDDRACKAALAATYDFGDAPSWRDRAYILFVEEKGKPRAVLPVADRAANATVTPDSAATVKAALADLPAEARGKLRLSLAVDASGAVTRCRIYDSSGADDGDLRACAAARTARFSPGRDIFGRPIADTLYAWRPTTP